LYLEIRPLVQTLSQFGTRAELPVPEWGTPGRDILPYRWHACYRTLCSPHFSPLKCPIAVPERARCPTKNMAGFKPRAGSLVLRALEEMQSKERSAGAPADGLTPEQVFERRWVQALMDQATIRLREEYLAKGEIAIYDQLKDLQPNERGALTYVQLAAQWGMTEAAVKTAKHRMNRRHQQLLREVIAHTVTRPSEIEDEIRHFMRVLGG